MLRKRIIYVTGLPRAGSTLLCQLLAQHPAVYSPGHSSPLAHVLQQLRSQLSDDAFLLAQLDFDPERVHQRLISAYRGFIDGWFAETEHTWVVDKNRAWLGLIETARLLDPEVRMLVCVRELGQVYGSIEAQHQRTLLLDFPDHLASLSRYARADRLFKDEGVIGRPLAALQAVQDLPEGLQQRLYYVVFEHLMKEPKTVLADICRWLGLPRHTIDPSYLKVRPHESDSHYRYKYPHQTRERISPPGQHVVPARIMADIKRQYNWFYQLFYPGLADHANH